MAKKVDYEAEFLERLGYEKILDRQYKDRRQIVILTSVVIYITIVSSVFVWIIPFGGKNNNSALEERVANIERDQKDIKEALDSIQSAITDSNNPNYSYLNNEIQKLKSTSQALSQTILEDPDKAVTAAVLRDRQTTLDEKFTELKTQVANTNQLLQYLLMAALVLPLIALIWKAVEKFIIKKPEAKSSF